MTQEPIVMTPKQSETLSTLIPFGGIDEIELKQIRTDPDLHDVFVTVHYDDGSQTVWAVNMHGDRRIISRSLTASVGE